MSERNKYIATPISDTSEVADEESIQEERQKTALQNLFLILETDAKKSNKPVNSAIRAIPMVITIANESKPYVLRINPALISNGKLSIAILDLYHNETSHLQQWVIKAEWKDEKPEITDLDESMVERGSNQFRLTEIAEYAGKMLSEKADGAQNLIMQMPTNYSSGVN
jgi:hypothetical protein